MIVQLYDPKRKSVLAATDGACEPEYADSNDAPTHDELLANNPASLEGRTEEERRLLPAEMTETFA